MNGYRRASSWAEYRASVWLSWCELRAAFANKWGSTERAINANLRRMKARQRFIEIQETPNG